METANAVRGEKGSSRATMKKQPQPARKEKRSTRNGAEPNSNSRRDRGSSIHGLRHPKSELESAIQRYVDLYDFAPIAYVSFDRAGRIEEANLAATELLSEPRDLLIGRPFAFYVADLDSLLRHLLYCRTSQQQVKTELLLKSRKGKQIPALLLSTPITSTARNGALLYQTAIIDLRDRKMAEEALRAKEAELEAIINRTPFMLTRCTRDLRFRFVSRTYAEMLGRPAEEITGKPIIEIVGKKAFKTILPYAEKVLQGHRVEYETEVSYRAARPRSMHCVYTPDRDGKGNVIGWFGSIIDVTQRKQAEDALRQSKNLLEKRVRARTAELHGANEELKTEISRRKGLEGQILEISDREQERLGQELHDGLCQQLTAIGFLARATALRLKNHRVVQTDDLEKIAQLINGSVMDARNIARDLHKEEIDAAEFLSALHDLVERKIWRTSCRLDLKTEVNIEDDNVASQLYRILREALINANKHARATQILLEVRRLKSDLVFSVTDNGVGLNTKTKTGHGLGFHIMKYRAATIGARLEFESLEKGGARVACYLPMTMTK
ncbi:MAG: hypothetical protein DME63_03655 [Verrucomicrobia bacterium]|nr:MAG: hypothetical protein DME63_03655 [Verrucomicrobiota bacterium]